MPQSLQGALHSLLPAKSYTPSRAQGRPPLIQHPSWKALECHRRFSARGHPRGELPGLQGPPGSGVLGCGSRGQGGQGSPPSHPPRPPWAGESRCCCALPEPGVAAMRGLCHGAAGTHPCRRRGRRRARPAADRRAPCPARRAGGGRAAPAPAPAATRS